jgi:hypothetical protein
MEEKLFHWRKEQIVIQKSNTKMKIQMNRLKFETSASLYIFLRDSSLSLPPSIQVWCITGLFERFKPRFLKFKKFQVKRPPINHNILKVKT